jgi:arylsulfatase A-like enzyme
MFRTMLLLLITLMTMMPSAVARGADRPNIVWIVVEDMSPHFGCYGETTIQTPNVDRLAAEGVKFTNAVVTAPVCSACRSALITGMYQTAIGAHHHRSGRGERKILLPAPVTPVPKLFGEAGYQALNLTFEAFVRSADQVKRDAKVGVAKTDYNFEWDEAMYDRTHWSARKADQPFFCQIQLRGGKLRGHGNESRWPGRVKKTLGSRTEPNDVVLPPYLPSHPVILEDWAQYLDTVRYTDWQVGTILDRLRAGGDLENTYIFFITDHGISHVRNKQFCYDGGMRIPLIVRGPALAAGTVRADPVEHIDLASTSLALAGIDIPAWMQARDVLTAEYVHRRYAVSARDRCDETTDRIRAVRTPGWKYIRNFHPQRPYLSPNRYKDGKPIVQTMRMLYAQGKLDDAQSRIMAEVRPVEELYDLKRDPYELVNLAGDSAHVDKLVELRGALRDWIEWSGDRGEQPEAEAMYDSDMAVYMKNRHPNQTSVLEKNIRQMKRWAEQGQ